MILYLAITTFILTVSLTYHNYQNNKNSFFLAGYLIPLCLYSILHYYVFEGRSVMGIAIFQGHISPFLYLPGAMLYFYVRGTVKNEWKFTEHDLWHFLPFFIEFLNLLPFYFTSFDKKIQYANQLFLNPNFNKFIDQNLFFPFYVSGITRCVLFFGYVVATNFLMYSYWKSTFKTLRETSKKNLFKWLTFLNVSAMVLAICFVVLTFAFFVNNDIQKADINAYHYTLIAGLTFCLIPLVMLFYPQVVYGVPISIMSERNKRNSEKEKISQQKDEIEQLSEKILVYFETEKPYLNKNFSLDDLAKYLGLPKHQLYTCFNNCINMKFTQLRTSFRIEHAKKLLLSNEMDTISLQGIWLQSGFSSKTNFFTTFKEETGLTPIEFIQQASK